jgi:ubiquinone/menaquinone biosynthesis C-methylase UbiE
MILQRLWKSGDAFKLGMDVGCGTGYSSIALTQFCERVHGIDLSAAMLSRAQFHSQVTYHSVSGDALSDLRIGSFDIVTFAGSLFYSKSEALREQLRIVGRPGTILWVYDFEVQLKSLMETLGLSRVEAPSEYDHQINLNGWMEFAEELRSREQVILEVSPEQCAHILLSDSSRFEYLQTRFSKPDPFHELVSFLSENRTTLRLVVDLYYARYRYLPNSES